MNDELPTTVLLESRTSSCEVDDALRTRAAWADFVERARVAHPKLDLDDFSSWMAERLPPNGLEGLARLDAGGLALVFGCLRGDRAALRRFENRHRPDIERALDRLRVSSARRDDLEQLVWSELLVTKNKLERYRGWGSLSNWVRAVAVRRILTALRKVGPPTDPLGTLDALADSGEPELDLFRAEYGDVFRDAFRAAIAGLGRADRTLLRFRYVDGLTLDRLARALGVHRATAARRLARVRRQLFVSIRSQLVERLGVEGERLDSIVQLVRSNFELSLGALVRSSTG